MSAPENPLAIKIQRVVGAVDVGMAVHATPRQYDPRGGGGGIGGRRTSRDAGNVALMVAGLVALLAKVWRPHLEKIGNGRAVRVMTERAVLLYRLVVPEERPALLHVAGVAGFVNAVSDHQRRRYRAVRVMTVGANDFAFQNRMTVRTDDLDALFFVAGEAHFRLSELVSDLIVVSMNLVATGAGEFAVLVRAPLPMYALAALVAGQAGLVAGRDRSRGILDEHAVRLGPFLAFAFDEV